MDWVFWIGLGLGAVISFPVSIVANLWTDRVRGYLDKRRAIRLSTRKSREVRTYLFVRALIEGNPSAKVILDIDISIANRAATFTVLCFGALGVMLSLYVFQPKIKEYPIIVGLFTLFFSLMALFFHAYGTMLHFEGMQIRRKIARFHDYENSIREKWGDDAIEQFLVPQETPPHA